LILTFAFLRIRLTKYRFPEGNRTKPFNMKQWSLLTVAALVLTLLAACGNDSQTDTSAGEDAPQISVLNEPSSVVPAGTVMHYICPKGCAGSGGPGQGACPVCGAEYIHNDAFHQQPGAPADGAEPITLQPPTPQTAEPPQNAKGVWHYTCPKGCPGGAGSATACAGCGGTLAHNPAYHQ
jgi:hypothetical protein